MNVTQIWIYGPRILDQLIIHKITFPMTSYITQIVISLGSAFSHLQFNMMFQTLERIRGDDK